jgi:hypothetical protein
MVVCRRTVGGLVIVVAQANTLDMASAVALVAALARVDRGGTAGGCLSLGIRFMVGVAWCC